MNKSTAVPESTVGKWSEKKRQKIIMWPLLEL